MENNIEQYLTVLNTLSVNTAIWVFISCFGEFYTDASQLSLDEIDNWVKDLHNQNIEEAWNSQKQMKYPHLFIYGMLWHYKYDTLKERRYQREHSENVVIPNSKKDLNRHTYIAE